MPGGQKEAYDLIAPVLLAISAKVNGEPCCTYIGPDGAGHYIKMVHNGIEYGDMQLICEAYNIMSKALGLETKALHEVFKKWNAGDLSSYLIEITRDIFKRIDEDTGKPLVEMVLDKAGQKGTGKWTAQDALDLGVAVPTLTMSVLARILSGAKQERVAASEILKGPTRKFAGDRHRFVGQVRQAYALGLIACYAQGFAQMQAASKEYGYGLKFHEIARIWKGGCIIRAKLLEPTQKAFSKQPDLSNLMLAPYFSRLINRTSNSLRQVVRIATNLGTPCLGFSSALGYLDSYRQARLPANLLQAQRDYFGAHTYRRLDREGVFHTEWDK